MERTLVIAATVATLSVGTPMFMRGVGEADAQMPECSCFASFDAVDSDLNYVGRYYKRASVAASVEECVPACDGWRRDWFYRNACDYPVRINRARNAWWGYETRYVEAFVGPDTWWCPFPPP